MVELGDRVNRSIWLGDYGGKHRATGTVVYIHPKQRYYVVEYRCLFGSFRESYPGDPLPHQIPPQPVPGTAAPRIGCKGYGWHQHKTVNNAY